jgi:hypothetical protein
MWGRVLLEKLIVAMLIKKFTVFYEERRIIKASQSPPLDPVLSQLNLIYKINPMHLISVLIFYSTPASPRWTRL